MKKIAAAAMILCVMLVFSVTANAALLPAGLTAINDQAFQGDSSLTGVLSLPEDVETVGADAFSGTNLHALIVPAGTRSVGRQAFSHAAYIRLNGADTTVGALSGVCYVIAPAGSPAQASGVDFTALEQLVDQGGFYYRNEGGSLTLLSAKNASLMGASVQIPDSIDGIPVTAVSPYAFIGCTALTDILLPAATAPTVTADATADCPAATVRYRGASVWVNAVTVDVAPGAAGSSITWHVDAGAEAGISSYLYTVKQNGAAVHTEESDSATFTYETEEPGEYQLLVTVTSRGGETATGASSVLYIAAEAMVMTVPETLQAGADLTIAVAEVEGALGYTVDVTLESTGELVHKYLLNEACNAVIPGYLLESGEYRVTGYVHGNDFRYTVPTVRNVTVTGTKAEGPAVPAQEPVTFNTGSIAVKLSDTDIFALRCQLRRSDGSVTEYLTYRSDIWDTNNTAYISFPATYQEGGTILVQASMLTGGSWTAWGPVTEILLYAHPTLAAPSVTCPETVQAGVDFSLTVSEVENAEEYDISILKGYTEGVTTFDSSDVVWSQHCTSAQTVYVSGSSHDMSAGEYTVLVTAANYSEGYAGGLYVQKLIVTGTRPTADIALSTSKDYVTKDTFDYIDVTVTAPGFESASISAVFSHQTGMTYVDGRKTVTLDSSGKGVTEIGMHAYDASIVSWDVRACVYVDGAWSDYAVVTLPIQEVPPLAEAIINVPESIENGTDLNFSFAPVEGAESYTAILWSTASTNSPIQHLSEAQPDKVYTVPGYELTAGTYYIEVEASSSEFGSSTARQYFTISGTKPAAPAVTADLDEIYPGSKLTFTIDTTGAAKVCILRQRIDEAGYGISESKVTATGDATTWSYTFSSGQVNQTFAFRFCVLKDGKWSALTAIDRTVQPVPPLDPPVIHAEESYLAGADLVFSIDPVENAEEYRYQLYAGDTFISSTRTPNTTITFSGCNHDFPAGDYRLVVTATSPAYDSGSSEYAFSITGTRPAAPAVTVDKPVVISGETFTISVATPGATLMKMEWENSIGWSSNGLYNVMEDTTLYADVGYDVAEYYYTFCVLTEGQWSLWSEPITITVTNSIPTPTLIAPSTLPQGSDLIISAGEVAGVTQYHVVLWNSYDLVIAEKYFSSTTDGNLLFEGYYFSPGSYRVEVRAYDGSYYSEWAKATVTVTAGVRPDAPAATADSDMGRLNTSYGFTIPTAGAEKAAVRYYRAGDNGSVTYTALDVTGDSTRWTHRQYSAGYTWNYAFAVQVDGVWSPWSTTLPVTITAREQLAQAVITAPDTVSAGADVVVSFAAVSNADSYSLRLVNPDGAYRSWTGYPGSEQVIPGYDIVPGAYRVVVIASGAEYDSSTAEKALTVTGERSAAPVVSVDTSEVFTGERYTFMIENGESSLIAWKYATDAGGGSSSTLTALTDVTAWETYANWAGVQSYQFCTLKDGLWSAWSVPIAVTISARPAMPEPVLILPDAAAEGRDLTVSFEAVEGASHYYVYLYTIYGQQLTSRYMSTAGSITFMGCMLPENYVRVQVTAHGSNGASSKASVTLKVTAASLAAAPAVTPPEGGSVAADSYAAFTVETAGAELAAVRYYRVGSPNDVTCQSFNVSGSDVTQWKTYLYNSGATWAFSFAIQVDGVWTSWSDFYQVSVE